ncbi:MAG: hypothetical protein V1921_04135 [Candidatus Altiarchaeota archaeon]
MKKVGYYLLLVLLFSLQPVFAEGSDVICVIYFSGVGCPHCAEVDPTLLGEIPLKYSQVVVVEYEVYKAKENVEVIRGYNQAGLAGAGIPQLLWENGYSVSGDGPILSTLEEGIAERLASGSPCTLTDGVFPFGGLDLNALPGRPKIWRGDAVLIRQSDENASDDVLKGLLSGAYSPSDAGERVSPYDVELSGSSISFSDAVEIGGWVFQWNQPAREPSERVGGRWAWYYVERASKFIVVFGVLAGLLILAVHYRKERKFRRA